MTDKALSYHLRRALSAPPPAPASVRAAAQCAGETSGK